MIERFFYAESDVIGRDIFFDPTYLWSTIWQEENLAIGAVYLSSLMTSYVNVATFDRNNACYDNCAKLSNNASTMITGTLNIT